jgi:hypothetical protein
MVRPRRVDFLFLLFFLFKSKSKPHVLFFSCFLSQCFSCFYSLEKERNSKTGAKGGMLGREREVGEERKEKVFPLFLSFSLSSHALPSAEEEESSRPRYSPRDLAAAEAPC